MHKKNNDKQRLDSFRNTLPKQIPSLLRPNAVARLEKILQSDQIIASYTSLADVSEDFRDVSQIGMYRCEATDLVHFYPLIVGKESLYAQLQRHSWYYLAQKNEYSIACKYVSPGDNVLEIGCGYGHFATFLANVKYTGLEYNIQAVTTCRSKGLNVFAETLEAFSPRQIECFEVVCAFQVLEHVPTPRAFIDSCLLCLKPGGHLILSVPADNSFAGLTPNYCLNLPPHHITRWSDKALYALRKEFNLQELLLESMPLENFHFDFYCDSIAGYEACQQLGLDHIFVEMEIWDKVRKLKTTLLPDIKRRLAKNFSNIRGHDVLVVGIK